MIPFTVTVKRPQGQVERWTIYAATQDLAAKQARLRAVMQRKKINIIGVKQCAKA